MNRKLQRTGRIQLLVHKILLCTITGPNSRSFIRVLHITVAGRRLPKHAPDDDGTCVSESMYWERMYTGGVFVRLCSRSKGAQLL